jgi:anaerobic magnesium-protoporphyrin IX monomethyl ester cyclase
MAQDFRERGLITNERLEEYDGTTAVVRTAHLPAEEIEYVRWKAERWMKVRHMPVALRHDPWFVVRHAPQMLAHTFRGCTLRSLLGLEDEPKAFERYKAIRRQEREFV